VEAAIMAKLNTKEDIALLVAEASEMFEETGYVPDVDGKKVRAERIVPLAKRYILETIDNPKSSYDTTMWHSPGYTLVLSWLSKKWLRNCQKFAPTVLKDVDLHLPKDLRFAVPRKDSLHLTAKKTGIHNMPKSGRRNGQPQGCPLRSHRLRRLKPLTLTLSPAVHSAMSSMLHCCTSDLKRRLL
jgi:hypothetical protein